MSPSMRNQMSGAAPAVTAGAVEDLGLMPGSEVTALIKSTEIALAAG
ncbi:TOBE domain-containing protein [Streptomyces lydicus]|nr:TOBE domain-containing protein [Streptomyces lydicus]MDC7340348.1 TOBE domain-containing protein [Streptomyces lydicus]UEG89979.1 TOBE domain-containing protein [Streptomyces lydicus]